MSVKFEVKMTDKIMYDFLLYHTQISYEDNYLSMFLFP